MVLLMGEFAPRQMSQTVCQFFSVATLDCWMHTDVPVSCWGG